jgi:DNA-binding NarL/FixJ family response regulator
MEVVGEAGDGIEAIAHARATEPDIILMDVRMPRCDGLEATRRIRHEMPGVKIVMLTVADDDEDLLEAIKSGAEGYLLKDLEPGQLYHMLKRVSRGEAPLSGLMAAKILGKFAELDKDNNEETEAKTNLTAREKDVVELVVEGRTNREIASSLTISENTVKIHVRKILEKLQARNRVQVAVYAVSQGLVGEGHTPANSSLG